MTNKMLNHAMDAFCALIASMTLLCCSEKNDDVTVPLQLSTREVTLEIGETASVKIISGNGSYSVSASDKVKVETGNEELKFTGIATGKESVVITDTKTAQKETVEVTVGPRILSLDFTDMEKWFTGTVPENADEAKYQEDQISEDGETSSFYKAKLGEDTVSIKVSTLSAHSWETTATLENAGRNAGFLKSAAEAFLADNTYEFYVAQLWDNSAAGANPKMIEKTSDLQDALSNTDFTKYSMRAAFKKGDNVIQIYLQESSTTLTVHTAVFGDNWLYYAHLFLGKDFAKTYTDNYMWTKSYGYIPGYAQIMIFSGRDSKETPFELDLYGELTETATVNKLEGYYSSLKTDHSAALKYWEAVMRQDNLGSFEQSIVYFNDKTKQPVILKSIDETISYAQSTDVTTYQAIMPIFRNANDYVIIPQLDKNGLVMVMSILKSEASTSIALTLSKP